MLRVGVLRGGNDTRYKNSLDNGAAILSCLRGDNLARKYFAVDIFIDEEGVWHINGIPMTMEKVRERVDVVLNALLGSYAESGDIQKLLEEAEIPYVGSDSISSRISQNKFLSKQEFEKLGIKTPKHVLFPAYQEDFDEPKSRYPQIKAREVWEKISPPWIVKPLTGGSSMGVHVCQTFQELAEAIEEGMNEKVSVLVEEFIKGKEATVGVVNNFRNKDIYVFPPSEIRLPKGSNHFDSEMKNSNNLPVVCPGAFREEDKKELERLAGLIHKSFNLKHFSKSDFIVHPKRGIYVLEVNTQSEFMNNSIINHALESVGSNLSELLDHLIINHKT